MKSQSDTSTKPARQAGAKIPDKPRDCGPHVDTWPILDAQGDAASNANSGKETGSPARHGKS